MNNIRSISISILTVSLVSIGASVILGYSLFFGFLIAILYSLLVLKINKKNIGELISSGFNEISKYSPLYITILSIGATVSVWLSSGVISSMVYFGFNFISGVNFLFFSFIIVSLCSIFMGTAVGTLSTIGLIMFTIGKAMNIPPEILLGAIISGAFLADKISPLSGLVNLNLKLCNVEYKKALRKTLITLLPTIFLTSLFFYLLGNGYILTEETSYILEMKRSIESSFIISPYFILFPLGIVLLFMFGIKPIYVIFSGIFLGSILTIFIQGYSFYDLITQLFTGFSLNNDSSILNILSGGGIIPMLEVVFIVASSIFLVHIMTVSGIMNFFIGNFVNKVDTPRELIQKTALISSFLTIFTCDQTLGIVIPSETLGKKYEEFGIEKEVLFRVISDTGVIIAPLFPWNINYIIISGIIGGPVAFVPFCALCYISPLLTFISSFFINYERKN